jgi:hypothetical protein
MNCAPAVCARSAERVWFGFSGGDVPRADEVPILWGKEKEMKMYGEFRTGMNKKAKGKS